MRKLVFVLIGTDQPAGSNKGALPACTCVFVFILVFLLVAPMASIGSGLSQSSSGIHRTRDEIPWISLEHRTRTAKPVLKASETRQLNP